MDATGSMRDELADLRASLLGIIRVLDRLAPSLRVGFVAYKDRGDPYVTRAFPLTAMSDAGAQGGLRFVLEIDAEGGGDVPEPVDLALEVASRMDWRQGAQGRIVVIGDAPAHARGWQRASTRQRVPGTPRRRRLSAQRLRDLHWHEGGRAFFEGLASAGGGEVLEHQGRMIESILVAVLRKPAGRNNERSLRSCRPARRGRLGAPGPRRQRRAAPDRARGDRARARLSRAHLGRHPALCERVIEDPSVSRRHLRIGLDAGALFVEDLNSLNGTLLDGAEMPPFRPVPLRIDQMLTLGRVELTLLEL